MVFSGTKLIISTIVVKFHDKYAQTNEESQKFTIYQMELTRKFLSEGMETVTVIFDLSNFSIQRMVHYNSKLIKNIGL
jgi:hypothetical protein